MNIPSCPKQLSQDQKEQFKNSGYLAFSNVLNQAQIDNSRNALHRIASEMSSDASAIYSSPQTTRSNQSGARFKRADSTSMFQLEAGYDPTDKSANELVSMVRKYMWFCQEDAVFQEMVSPQGNVGSIINDILGDHAVLFQEMALVKPARIGSEKPWHQDNAYFSMEPLDAIVGVWVALDDATPENGCMHVIPRGHLDGAAKHYHRSDCEIDPLLLNTEHAIPVPIPAGGALFFYGMLPHRTPPNLSDSSRRALQFHFHGSHARIVDEAAYDRIFASRDGLPASCRAASKHGF